MRKALCLALVLGLVSLPQPVPAQTPSTDPDIVRGMAQVDEGDYDAAILTLDNAARRLAQDPKRTGDLSQAYLYLGIAYMGKGHEAAARAKFREALGQIKDLTLSPEKFPPKVIDAFEAAKEEAQKSAPAAPPTEPTTTASAPATPEKKKGGSGKILLIVGGLAAAGGIAAAAAGGGGSSSAGPTTTTLPPDPRKVQNIGPITLTDTSAGYQNRTIIVVAGSGVLDATVTWTSTGGSKAAIIDMVLDDNSDTTVARSNRTTDTTSVLQANVAPLPGAPSQEYRLYTELREQCGGCTAVFNLTVKHP
jgi:hypothetical protein